MDKASINIRERFNLILQVLRDVVRSPERHLRRQDNVNFYKVVRTRVIDSTRVHLENFVGECHGLDGQPDYDGEIIHLVNDKILEICRGGYTGKMGELFLFRSARNQVRRPSGSP